MPKHARLEAYSLESVSRTVLVLRTLEASGGPQTLDELARASGLSESTALRYLSSLAAHDLVERDSVSGKYLLGLGLFQLGNRAIAQRDVAKVAAPVLEALRSRFEETVNFAARQRDQVVLLEVRQSARSLRKGNMAGAIDSWHATALGKAMLAAMAPLEAAEIIDSISLTAFTPNTISNADDLLRELEAIRTRGYAIDDEESDEGLRCVGVHVLDHLNRSAFGMSVSGPKSRMPYSRISEIGAHLVAASAELTATLNPR